MYDFECGLRYLARQFEDLETDADHEIIYEEGRYMRGKNQQAENVSTIEQNGFGCVCCSVVSISD